jgi:hypothetical protein
VRQPRTPVKRWTARIVGQPTITAETLAGLATYSATATTGTGTMNAKTVAAGAAFAAVWQVAGHYVPAAKPFEKPTVPARIAAYTLRHNGHPARPGHCHQRPHAGCRVCHRCRCGCGHRCRLRR